MEHGEAASAITRGRRRVHHDSLFLPVRILLTSLDSSAAPSEKLSQNFIDTSAGAQQFIISLCPRW